MSTLTRGNNALPPSRTKKKPRKLNYNKCRFCRDPKVKTKCVWNRGPWPSKCQRCSEKALPCSEPRHKSEEHHSNAKRPPAAFHTSSNVSDTVSRSDSAQMELERPNLSFSGVICLHEDPGSFYEASSTCSQSVIDHNEGLMLQLLPLQGMTQMALEEIKLFTQDFLAPFMPYLPAMYRHYEAAVNRLYCKYEVLAWRVRQCIDRLAPHSKLAMDVALDLSTYSHLKRIPTPTILEKRRYSSHIEKAKKKYSEQKYLGILILLTMYESTFEDSSASIESSLKDIYLSTLNTFLDKCTRTFAEFGSDVAVLRRQGWFIPTKILKISSIRSSLRAANFKDFLGRSISLIEYDSGIPMDAIEISHDPPDYMGRMLLHASCVRNDTYAVDMLLSRRSRCSTRTEPGLTPLHIAAMTGHLEIFKKLHDHYRLIGCLEPVLMGTDLSSRTILQLAGCVNHQILEFFLSFHMFKLEQSERSDTDGNPYHFVDRSGKIRYETETVVSAFQEALRDDREKVVRLLATHFDTFVWDHLHRTPLWYASYYGRCNAIPLLSKLDSINVPDTGGRTPLMVAAVQGSENFVRQLLYQGELLMENTGHSAQPVNALEIWLSNKEKKTAKDLAVEGGHYECARILGANMYMSIFPGHSSHDH